MKNNSSGESQSFEKKLKHGNLLPYRKVTWIFSLHWGFNIQLFPEPMWYRCFPLMGSNIKSLSLVHLAMAHTSHLAFSIQGDP